MNEPYKQWTVNLEEKTAIDKDGITVKFFEHLPGTLEGEIQNPDDLANENDAVPLIQDAARAFLSEMKRKREQQQTQNNGTAPNAT